MYNTHTQACDHITVYIRPKHEYNWAPDAVFHIQTNVIYVEEVVNACRSYNGGTVRLQATYRRLVQLGLTLKGYIRTCSWESVDARGAGLNSLNRK